MMGAKNFEIEKSGGSLYRTQEDISICCTVCCVLKSGEVLLLFGPDLD